MVTLLWELKEEECEQQERRVSEIMTGGLAANNKNRKKSKRYTKAKPVDCFGFELLRYFDPLIFIYLFRF